MGTTKDLRKAIKGLQRVIDQHHGKITEEKAKRVPDWGVIRHWEREIAGIQKRLNRLRARLGAEGGAEGEDNMVLAPEEVVVEKDRLKGILATGGFEDSLLAMHLAEIQESVEAVLEYMKSLREDAKRKQEIRDTLIDLSLTLDHLIHHSQEALTMLEPDLGLD